MFKGIRLALSALVVLGMLAAAQPVQAQEEGAGSAPAGDAGQTQPAPAPDAGMPSGGDNSGGGAAPAGDGAGGGAAPAGGGDGGSAGQDQPSK